ncbi:DUF4132 domain-containing protein [Actinoplanes hulinensis]|uniref:DUF4132 domain-containing protein n=1 Tax=Actinoplanes hulinensis TaxID=1144547 RepID=A0ABS7BF73_9ACTN|nr:DUF4132 domain-containing protein [Actinoplanes hulinensis]MBW6439509.1 DUF4132 domain-containing protein [Actinoplanes hulinensis]
MSFDLPEPWSSQLHPRRGGAGVRPVVPDPRAREVVDGQMRELPVFIPGVLASVFTEPALAAAGRAWLDRDPAAPAEGAAVVALAGIHLDSDEHERHPWFADLWLSERGLLFAAEAVVAMFSMFVVDEGDAHPLRKIHRDGTETMGVRRRRVGEGGTWALFSDPHMLMLLRIRAALAAASAAVHAETVSALAPLRALGPHARCATSVLVPSRSEWVAADWAEALAEPDRYDDRIRFLRDKSDFYRASLLLNAIGTPDQAATALALPEALGAGWPGGYATLVDGLGPAAVPLLLRRLDELTPPMTERRKLIALLAVLPDDAAFGGLIDRAAQQDVRRALIEATGRFPERALRLLAVPAGKPVLSDLLAGRVRADPALAERVVAGLTGAPAARIRECLASVDTVVPAPPEALPPLLADPPWRRRRASPPVVLALPALDAPDGVVWRSGEREEWLSTPADLVGPGDWAGVAERLRRGETVDQRVAAEFFVNGPEETARSLLAEWKPVPTPGCGAWMRRIVARFEVDALPPLRHLARNDGVEGWVLMQPFTAADVAWRMQARPSDRSRHASLARAWLDRHPEFAARYLLPRAFGPDGPARRAAQITLVSMVSAGHTEAIRSVAAFHGPEAAAAVEALIVTEPTEILPGKLPAIPKWFDPALLPPVRLRRPAEPDDGPALVLPAGLLRELAMVFALHQPPTEPYPGVEIVQAACEPADLARFAWGVFDAWLAAGANGRQGWALDALGLVGDDEVVRRLTPLIMEWPGQSGHARAVTGTGILAAIGTDVALTHLQRIVERSRFNGLRAAAERQVAHVAETMGLTAEQLADRLVPDLGLDGDGSLTLDYGPRRFVVGFDEELKPFVVDGAGKRLKNLPKPGARDDAERATAAYQRFTALKKEVRALAADQIRRLERAMVTGRRWPEEEFRRYYAGHPLVRHLTRRLLWGRYDGSGALIGGFRVAEDGTLADVRDDVTTIAGDETIGVVHPVHLGAALPLWSEVFTDYQIVQPFAQLGRETAALTPAEAAGCKITRFRGRRVPTGAVLGLERRGWRRERPLDGGVQIQITVSPIDGLEVVLDLDPGIAAGAVDLFPEQTLGELGYRGRVAALGDLDPAVVSEVLRDLESLT